MEHPPEPLVDRPNVLDYSTPAARRPIPWRRIRHIVGVGVILPILLIGTWTLIRHYQHEREVRLRCAANFRAIWQGILVYSTDNQGQFPQDLLGLVMHTDLNCHVFECPSFEEFAYLSSGRDERIEGFKSRAPFHYIYLGKGWTINGVKPNMVVAHERSVQNDHGAGMNVLYADGRVLWLDEKRANHVLSDLSKGFNPPR